MGPVLRLQKYILQYNLPLPVRKLFESPSGPFTVFFWCGAIKWFISFVNINDIINLPADKISTYQQLVLILTGTVWARYSTVIIPINYNLMTANLFMASVAIYQLKRK